MADQTTVGRSIRVDMAVHGRTFLKYVEKVENGCWIWTGRSFRGYGVHRLQRGWLFAHRVAYVLFKKEQPGPLFVCHHCDNPKCVNPDHLFLGDSLANERDKIAKGRAVDRKGEKNPAARLTVADVTALRRAAEGGESAIALALRFGIAASYARKIINRSVWSHVET